MTMSFSPAAVTGLVGLDFSGSGSDCLLFCRAEGGLESRVFPFHPFVLLTSPEAPGHPEITRLQGRGQWCYLAEYELSEYEELLPELRKCPGARIWRSYSEMFLARSGIRYFAGLSYHQLVRMQLAVTLENGTMTGLEAGCSTAEAVSFSGSESDVLSAFLSYWQACDPDVIEGHGLFSTVLPVLHEAAKRCKMTLPLGRNGNPAECRSSRFSAAEKVVTYNRYTIAGRELIDTELLAQLHDVRNRDFSSFDLDYLAEFFNFTVSRRVEKVKALAELWEPSYFYRAGVLPLSFQDLVLKGTGTALDALMTAGYLEKQHSIPFPQESRPYAGALTVVESFGVFHNVRHCDVRSLYPSLMAVGKVNPQSDELGLFNVQLQNLLRFRIAAKEASRNMDLSAEVRQEQQALQEAYKILINSFYGYLGYAQASFNDYDLAESITAQGRALLEKLLAALHSSGSKVIEADTDGIYFVPGNGLNGDALEQLLREQLPEAVVLEFDADFPAMFSYKSKNYALLTEDGELEITGSALKSRSMEGFQLKFIATVCRELLTGNRENIITEYQKLQTDIATGEISLSELVKQEALKETPASYSRKLASGKGRRSAAYEVALASGQKFKAGDTVRYYVTGDKKKVSVVDNCCFYDEKNIVRNENRAYYLEKLAALFRSFEEFILDPKI